MRAPIIGPSPEPIPRTPISSPRPESPTLKTFDARTASWLTIPAPTAKVIFEQRSASITGSFFATLIASFMSAIGRTRPLFELCVRSLCIGRFTPANNSAATTNETAFAMNAAFRPNTAAKTPPIAAPTASMVPHVLPKSALVLRKSSSLSTKFGIDAVVDGPTNDASAAMRH